MRLHVTQPQLSCSILALIAVAGCVATKTSDTQLGLSAGAQAGANGIESWPTCNRAAALDDPTVVGSCKSARALLKCADGEICLTENASKCPMTAATSICSLQCGQNEYAVSCGGAGPASAFGNAPMGCHGPQPTAVGVVYYCCPCAAE
jgi:hypothetical protein